MNTFRLELSAIKSRQSKSEALLHELREELTQSSEDLTRHRSVVSKDSISIRLKFQGIRVLKRASSYIIHEFPI